MALDALCGAVPPEMVSTIGKKATAKEAWSTIATMRVGDDRVKKATVQHLRRKFDLATFEDGESVEDYALRLNNMAAHLATLDEELKDADIVVKMLRSLPPRFKQITIAIKTLLDVSTMSVADLTGRLKEAEEAFEEVPASLSKPRREQVHVVQDDEEASLLLVKLSPTLTSTSPPQSTSKPSTGSPAPPPPPAGSPAPPPPPAGSPAPPPSTAGSSAPPPSTAAPLPRANPTSQGAGQEHGGDGSRVTASGSHAQIKIRAEKVFAHLGEEKEREAETWVLDTGATNHMSGSRAAFSKLDTAVLGTVRFGDDSVVQIEGRGSVAFVCKNDELWSFSGVYFIPQLMTNIVSIGQLDEDGYKVDIDVGVIRIWESSGQLLVKVTRATNRLYVLCIKMATLSCLAVHGRDGEAAWRWHERFGHVNMAALRKLAREELVHGLPEIGQVDQLCEACQAGK
ncbi:uncharacterized protein [Setaria viridis]|uniref:uncharacterized protein n=1 Tax=Setaria viridis TaxID=4556 RepID=UPI003B3BA813